MIDTNPFQLEDNSLFWLILQVVLNYVWIRAYQVIEKYLIEVKYLISFTVLGFERISGMFLICIWIFILCCFPSLLDNNFIPFTKFVFNEGRSLIIYYGFITFSLLCYNAF